MSHPPAVKICLFDVGNGHLHVKFAALAATLYSLTGQN